jgi:hypothetical protein
MQRSPIAATRNNRINAALIAATLLLLTGCGAGPNAPTRLIQQVTDGVEARIGDVKLLHMLLVKQSDGSAVLVGTVINNGTGPDQITRLSANGISGQISPMNLIIKPDAPLIFAGESANALAVFPGLNVKAGEHVNLEVALSGSGVVVLETLVRDRIGEFANVGPTLLTQ